MSLQVDWLCVAEEKKYKYYKDVEVLFNQVELVDTPEVREILRLIEKAEYVSSTMFRDRFGGQLYTSSLSMGCKAAIAVLLGDWSDWISLIEVGTDAMSVILSFCKRNKVLLRDNVSSFHPYASAVDIYHVGRRFLSLEEFNLYISEERGW